MRRIPPSPRAALAPRLPRALRRLLPLLLGSLAAACTARLDISEETDAGPDGPGPATPPGEQPDASAPAAHCDDELQNGDETGVDCGGSCGRCPTSTCECASSPALTPLECDETRGVLSPCGERLLSADGETFVFTLCHQAPEDGATAAGYQSYRRRADGAKEALGNVGPIGLSRDGERILIYDSSGASVVDGAGARTPVPIAAAFASDARMSRDGSSVFGTVTAGAGGARLVRWTASGGAEPLAGADRLGDAGTFQLAGVSHDGSAAAGYVYDGVRVRAFRWTAEGGLQELSDPPEGADGAQPEAISADGSTIAGYTMSGVGRRSVFRWTEPGQFQVLGAALPAGYRPDARLLLSADGTLLVGAALLNGAPSLVRWGGGGTVVANAELAYALDLTPDGSTLVGLLEGAGGFSWQPPATVELTTPASAYDVTRLDTLLARAGADTTGWDFEAITNVSDDARVVYGTGTCGGVQTYYRLQLEP